MPYIKKERRLLFEDAINAVVLQLGDTGHILTFDGDKAKGELNYVIFTIIKRYLDKNGMTYARAQDMIGGVLSCCQMELYRKLLAPYEQKAEETNGSIE